MLDWSDRHFRYFMRQISKNVLLYTEMVVSDAIIHGNRDKLLQIAPTESPVIIQLGGSDPRKLAIATQICQDYGYSGINLNVGCPSNRVRSGNFGACLMADPNLVAKCFEAMNSVSNLPISIKHRTGLGYQYSFEFLYNFVRIVSGAGCRDFIIHARNAILDGLSPKQNRDVPPLCYDYVYQLKQLLPSLNIIINGGIKTKEAIKHHLNHVDGVMIGREVYHNPYLFADFDLEFYNQHQTIKTRQQIANAMIDYLEYQSKLNVPLYHITRHMLGLYYSMPNATKWRYALTQEIRKHNHINTYLQLLSDIKFIDN